jgi:hypothetical protein
MPLGRVINNIIHANSQRPKKLEPSAAILPEPLKPGIITRIKGGEAVECESEILCPAMLTNWWRS